MTLTWYKGDPGFPQRGDERQPLSFGEKPIILQDFFRNLHENEKQITSLGTHATSPIAGSANVIGNSLVRCTSLSLSSHSLVPQTFTSQWTHVTYTSRRTHTDFYLRGNSQSHFDDGTHRPKNYGKTGNPSHTLIIPHIDPHTAVRQGTQPHTLTMAHTEPHTASTQGSLISVAVVIARFSLTGENFILPPDHALRVIFMNPIILCISSSACDSQ